MKLATNSFKLLLLLSLIGCSSLFAQVKIGNNPKVMLPGALLELEHNSKALVITRVTTAQMNAIQANEGMLVYNTSDSCIYQRTSTTWKSLCSSNISPQSLTNGRGIIVMDGTGAVLKATSLRIDSSEIAKMLGEKPIIDSLAKVIGRAPIKDNIVQIIKDSISAIIKNTNVSGNDAVGSEIIKITGGAGAVLKSMTISVDSTKMLSFISNNINKSPLKDSLSTSITNIINNNGLTGKNMTSGSLVNLTGTPTGSLLKDVNIDINTTKLKDSMASWINDKPISDSISKFVSSDTTIIKSLKDSVIKEINNGSVTGKNATQGVLVKVTGGNGAVLKDMKIEADTAAMKTFIANNLNVSPIKDSLSTSITNIINNGTVTGKNMTSGSLVTLTGTPSGSLLKDVNIDINTTKLKDSIASWINDKPISDSISKFVTTDSIIVKSLKDSVISEIKNGSVVVKDMTNGDLIKLTGKPIGALFNDVKVDINTAKMKDSIAAWVNKKPISDSITKLMKDSISTIIKNGSITGNDATQGSLITITGGTGAVLKSMKVEVDTNAMKTFIANNLNTSPIKDSLGSSITNIINNNGVTGKDIMNGNGIIVSGGTGAALKTTSLRIDSTAIAKMMNQSPVKDSVTKLMKDSISSIISNGAVSGKALTGVGIKVSTNGATSTLKDVTITWDSSAVYSKIKADSVAITNMIVATGSVDLDKDSTNEIQKLSLSGSIIKLSKNGDSVSIAAFKNMAKNGTSISGDSVVLGGSLDRATTITASATNTLSIKGLQAGNAKTDSILSDSAGVVKHVSIKDILSSGPNWVEITASYTAKTNDQIILFRGTSNATLTLPSASSVAGKIIEIMNYAPSNNYVILTLSPAIVTMGAPTDLVDTELVNILKYYGSSAGAAGGNSIRVFSNGTSWFKLSN
jgi:hypothetical protein